MTAATKLGEQLRKLGSLLSVRQVRADDQVRESRRMPDIAARADEIEREATTVEKSL